MTTLSINSALAEFVTQNQFCTAVLNRYGLDFCCGGQRTLQAACASKGLDADQVLNELTETAQSNEGDSVNWADESLLALADHILDTHHVYVKQEMPRLSELVEKVAAVYPLQYSWVTELNMIWGALRAELEAHLMKEEQVLFPRIKELCAAESGSALPSFHCGSVGAPVQVMEQEHDNAGEALRQMRTITNNYQAPENACTTFKLMLQGLEAFEADLHQHVHKENNILFPKTLDLEQALSKAV